MRNTLKVLKDVETRKSLVAKAIRDGNVSVKDFMSLQEQYAFVYKDHSGNSALGMGRSGSANLSGSTNDYIQFIITTLEEDRDGDIVVPMGRVGKNYANNPVWFFGHQEWEIPIGTSRAPDGSIAVVSQRDKCISNFYPDRADPDAMFVFGKVQRGILNATSIAFVPLIAQRREEMYKSNPRDTRPSGWRFDSWDHTETSIVGVPANAGAIRDSLDKEKSFITPKLQKALKPYAAKSRKEQGIVWSGWCPNGDCTVKKAAKKDCGCKSKSTRQKMNYHSVASLKAGTPLVWNGKDVTLWSVIGGGANDPGSMYLEVKLPNGKVETVDYREVQAKSLAESSGTSGGYTVPPCECGGKPDCPCGNKKKKESAVKKGPQDSPPIWRVEQRNGMWWVLSQHSNPGSGPSDVSYGPYKTEEQALTVLNRVKQKAMKKKTPVKQPVRKGIVTLWKVTGWGGPKNKYGRYDKFQTVEVVASTKQEAIDFAKTVLPPEKQEKFDVKEYMKVDSANYPFGPVKSLKSVKKADMDEEDQVMKDDAHDLIAEDIEMEEPFTVKPSAASIVKTYQHAKAEAEFLEDEIAKLDHPGIEEGLTKYKAKYVDPRMEHLKGMLHTHHAKGEGDPDEFLDKCMKGMETDGTGGSETDPGEEGMVQAGEIPPDDEVVSKRHIKKGRYKLVSSKGTRTVNGTEQQAIAAALRMEGELQPAFGVSVEDEQGNTVANVEDGQVEKSVSKRRKSVRKSESKPVVGDKVYHAEVGNGTIVSVLSEDKGDGCKLKVKFDNGRTIDTYGMYLDWGHREKSLEDDNISEEVEDKDLDLVEWAEQEEAEPEHEEVIDEGVGINPDEDTEEILERYQHPKNLKWYTRKVGTAKRVGNKLVLVKEAEFLEEKIIYGEDCEGEDQDDECRAMFANVGKDKDAVEEKIIYGEDCEGEDQDDECRAMFANVGKGKKKSSDCKCSKEKDEDDDLSPEDMERLKQLTNRLKDYGFAI